jgi:hypothetical protein
MVDINQVKDQVAADVKTIPSVWAQLKEHWKSYGVVFAVGVIIGFIL